MKFRIALLLFILLVGVWFAITFNSGSWRYLERVLAVGIEVPDDYGDVIIVFGAGCQPGIMTQERLNVAARLYAERPRPVIITEGFCRGKYKKEFDDSMQVKWGINPEDVYWDTLSMNTRENAEFTARYCHENGFEEVIICTSRLQQMRAYITLKKTGIRDFRLSELRYKEQLACFKEPYRSGMGKLAVLETLKSIHELFLL
jgi:uncharacterized SAM-binding protein YcdF (DUF218 family)